MLAAMSSLASLAHEARTAAPRIQRPVYATAATIIPVLFLAIAVQGPLYGDLLKASGTTLRRFREHKSWLQPAAPGPAPVDRQRPRIQRCRGDPDRHRRRRDRSSPLPECSTSL